MKNTLQYSCLLILLAVVMLFSACQPTPDNPIVISKNDGTLEEKLHNDPVEFSFGELPSSLEETFPGKVDCVTIEISADIDVPSSIDKIPVKEYDVREVDVALIQQVADLFMEGKTMYEPQYQLTKAQLKEEMREVEELLDENRLQEEYGDIEEMGNMIREIQTMRYSILQSFYEEAPDEVEKVEAVIEFKPIKAYLNQAGYAHKYASASYFAKRGDESGQRELEELEALYTVGSEEQVQFKALAELDNGYTGMIYATNGVIKEVGLYDNSIAFRKCTQTDGYGEPFYVNDTGYPIQPLTITQEQALEMADSAMKALGFKDDYVVIYSERIDGGEESQSHYEIKYAREVAPGLETLSYFDVNTNEQPVREEYDNALRPSYGDESISFVITDEGIVGFGMGDLLREVETVNESVEIMDFNDIYTIFKDHASIKYDGKTSDLVIDEETGTITAVESDRTVDTEVKFNQVRFATMRIAKKDDLMSYLIVPVWIFSGQERRIFDEYNKHADATHIIINAIDGTIISDVDCY